LTWPSGPARSATRTYWNLQNYDTHGFGLWALELLATGTFIGDVGVTYQNRRISITMLNKKTEEALRADGMERCAGGLAATP
jgi:RimJ/RimL family protein N-acetyltransferase